MNNLTTRQYVGARYVPIVTGEWDINLAYENLSIVTHNQNSYTSKKPVPAGIEISNTEYWTNTGSFNAYINELTNKLNNEMSERETADTNLENKINSEITGRETAVAELENKINSEITGRETVDTELENKIKEEITARETANAELENKIYSIYPRSKQILLFGDSYMAGTGGINLIVEQTIEELTQWDVTTYAHGGSGYIHVNDGIRAYELVEQAINEITNKNLITDVVFAFSCVNDMAEYGTDKFNYDNIFNALKNINTLLIANFKNANIHIAPALWINKSYNFDYTTLALWEKMASLNLGWHYAEGSINWLMLTDDVNYSDNLHPNNKGYQLIADRLINLIRGGNGDIISSCGTLSCITGDSLNYTINRGMVSIFGEITMKTAITFTKLCDLPRELQKCGASTPLILHAYGTNINDQVTGYILQNQIYLNSLQLTVGQLYTVEIYIPAIFNY